MNALNCAHQRVDEGSDPFTPVHREGLVLLAPSPVTESALPSMNRNDRVAAIDIGRNGAVALFDHGGQLVDVEDLPVLQDGPACRPTINAPLLAVLIRRWQPTQAVVEHVSARPGEAPSGAFAFGQSRGTITGVLGAQAIPIRWVTPAWWKRRAGIPPGRDKKDMARSVAIARWPDRAELFARVRDHDRAEACLIGFAHITDTQQGTAA